MSKDKEHSSCYCVNDTCDCADSVEHKDKKTNHDKKCCNDRVHSHRHKHGEYYRNHNEHDDSVEFVSEDVDQAEQIIRLQSDVKSLSDKLMRALAEVQNTRRIADKEKSDALKYGISKFAKDILVIRDTMKLALANADESSPIVDGIKQVINIFDKTVLNYGIKIIESDGAQFDPNYHQAIMEVESDLEPGMVVQVMQDGFVLEDRLLRPAMVTVSKQK